MRKIFVLTMLACLLLLSAAAQAAQITDVKWGVNKENILRFVVDLDDTAGYAVDMEGNALNLTVNAGKNAQVASSGRVKSVLATSYQVVDKGHYSVVRVPLLQRLSAGNYKAFVLKADPKTHRPFRVVMDIKPAQSSVKAPVTTAPVVSSRPVVSNRPTRPAGARPAANSSTVTKQSTAVKTNTNAAQTAVKQESKQTAVQNAEVKQPAVKKETQQTAVKKAEAKQETKQSTTKKNETKQPAKKETKSSTASSKVNATTSSSTKIVGNGKFRTSGGLSGKIITLDAGHGGSDPGAIGSDGTKEKEITLAITKQVQKLLEDKGAKVYMTRTTDVDVYGPNASDVDELQARVNVGEKYNSDLFVSLHINSSVNKNVGGFSTYYYPKTNNDLRIAKSIQDQLAANFGVDDLGVRQANFYVIKRITMPATLVEMCFISNEKELVLMKGKWFQNKTARLIAAGIEKYFA